MAQWLYPDEPKRVSGELRLSDCAETASSVAGACCLIIPDAMMTRCYPANFLVWGNRIFTANQPHHSRRVGKGREKHSCEAHTAWPRSRTTRTRVSTPGNPMSGGESQHNVTIDSPTQEHGLFQALVPHLKL